MNEYQKILMKAQESKQHLTKYKIFITKYRQK